MTEDTYRDKLNSLQVEIEELRAKLAAYQSTMGQLSDTAQSTKEGDLISRAAALDVVFNNAEHPDKAYEAIRHLPSVQPERTCVNCGRTVNNGGWYADGGTRCPIEEHYALPKDGYCHLWEKRNVTDDDYPERRTDE